MTSFRTKDGFMVEVSGPTDAVFIAQSLCLRSRFVHEAEPFKREMLRRDRVLL